MDALKKWWALDEKAESTSADNPFAPLSDDQRRETLPLLTLAFGWGFLVTGLLVGAGLGQSVSFWPDLVVASFAGNFINFVIGALVGYMGYRTACNSGLLYKFGYGTVGAYVPVIFLALLLIGWQGIVVGAFGAAWAQLFSAEWVFYVIAIFAGVLYTVTTYFGIKGLELVSVPAVFILVIVGLYAMFANVTDAGGWQPFLAMSDTKAAQQPMGMVQAINLVVGSWIVGAIVMAEYTRFAKKAWVALAIPFIVLIIAQWFLQIVGSMGGIVAGTYDFTTYMLQQGMIIGGLGTILGLNIYTYFIPFIDLLANITPPLIGPVIVEYYLINKMRFQGRHTEKLPVWNPAAFLAYAVGAISTFFAPAWIMSSLLGLIVSMAVYLAAYYIGLAVGFERGYADAVDESETTP